MNSQEQDSKILNLRTDVDWILLQLKKKREGTSLTTVSKTTTVSTPNPVSQNSTKTYNAIVFGFDYYVVGTETWHLPIRPGFEGTLIDVLATSVSPPTGSSLVLDIQRSKDSGASWQTMLSGTLQITATNTISNTLDTFAIPQLHTNDLVRATVLSGPGDATEVCIVLRYK